MVQRETHITDLDRFPPTVVGSTTYRGGIELDLLDPGLDEAPRYVWIPDDPDEETVRLLQRS
jgi:hypothetical protein